MDKKRPTKCVKKQAARRAKPVATAPIEAPPTALDAEPPGTAPPTSRWDIAVSATKRLMAGLATVAMLVRVLLVSGGFGAGWMAKSDHVVIPAAEPAQIVRSAQPPAKKKPRSKAKAEATGLGLFDPFR